MSLLQNSLSSPKCSIGDLVFYNKTLYSRLKTAGMITFFYFCKSLYLLLLLAFGLILVAGVAYANNSTGLAAALQATMTRHPALSGKRAEVEAKVYGGASARAQRYPSLSGQYSAHDDDTRPFTLRARQPLWAFGRIDSVIAYADADILTDEADLVRVKRRLMDQTAVAYARVQGSRQRLTVAVDNIARLDILYQQIKRREQGHLAPLADVRIAYSRLLQGRAQKERFKSELTIAESELLALTQIPVDTSQSVPASMTRIPELAQVEALAQAKSSEVLFKTQRVDLSRTEVEREKVSSMPTVYLQAERYYNQPAYDDDSRVGVVMEANLDGMGFLAAGRSKEAGARLQASKEDLSATRNELSRTVKSLYANRELQQSLIYSQNQSVSELTEIVASYQRQYESGFKSWLEVLNMQRELNDQQLQQAQAESEWLIYTLKLVVLTGGLDALVEKEKE